MSKTRGFQPHQPWMDLGLGWRAKGRRPWTRGSLRRVEGMWLRKTVPRLLEDLLLMQRPLGPTVWEWWYSR